MVDELCYFFFLFSLKKLVSFFGASPVFKGTLQGMRQFLITESPLKMMKNAFYFTLKALCVLSFLVNKQLQ